MVKRCTHMYCWILNLGWMVAVVLVHKALGPFVKCVDGFLTPPQRKIAVLVEVASWDYEK